MKKILVLGYFGYETNKLNGQTVKTRDVFRLVEELAGEGAVDYFDTQSLRRNRLLLLQMFWKVMRCNTLFYLPAHNNLRVFFPFIFCLAKIFRVKIHYFVVGGWLREFLGNLPLHRWMLRHIEGIHAETKRLKRELEDYYHYSNVDIFPNFRFFEFTPQESESDKLRLVFMARVTKKKGLDWIFALADHIAAKGQQAKYSITFFGPVAVDDRQYFDEKVAQYDFVEYRSTLQPADIHDTLSRYDLMLLPTHYYTEGLPGSVVDAYISGIPVIVTEWKHAREFVDDGKSGYIVPFEGGLPQMIERVEMLCENRELLRQLKANALVKRMEFAPPSLDGILSGGGKYYKTLRLCFISRVEQSKGLDTLCEVAKVLAEEGIGQQVKIDFYGQKQDDYFDCHLNGIGMFEYKGVLQPDEVIPTLKRYDALIFPSHYDGEGCPGILVEALFAALPIIASDWKYNSEFVADGDNGFLCETFGANSYAGAIKALLTNAGLRGQMSRSSYGKSRYFSATRARELMKQLMGMETMP